MAGFEKLSNSQKIRAAIHRDVRAISSETCHFLGLEVTKPAMEVIAELVYKKISLYGTDLEAFCKHAKRNTVNSEDVKLLVRRNPSLLAHLNTITPSTPAPPKRRKTVTKPQETPAKPKEDSRNKEKVPEQDIEKHKEEKDKENVFEQMVVDDTIDLTFD